MAKQALTLWSIKMENFWRQVLNPQGSYTQTFTVCKIRTYNQLCNTSAHNFYGNKHNDLILKGLHVFSSLER